MMHLFLSPHYDDAVYSCGGTLYQLAQAGEAIRVWTLFAGDPQPPFPDTPVLADNHTRWAADEQPMQMRRAEDDRAAEILSVQTQHAPLLDCLYRTHPATGAALYPTEASLWKVPHPADPTPAQLDALPLPDAVTTLYAPLGVGEHVDHLLVRDWALRIGAEHPVLDVRFYEEYPYLRQRATVQTAVTAFPQALQTHLMTLTEPAMRAKIAAMRAYTSQIGSFWDDDAAIAPEVRATFTNAANGAYVERYWVPTGASSAR